MTENTDHQSSLVEKLHSETARIRWHELQRFFAQGSVLLVSDKLDLVRVAVYFAQDDSEALKPYLDTGQVAPPADKQAKEWYDNDVELWSVVVAPFVLVQEKHVN